MNTGPVQLQLTAEVNGRTWRLFQVDFDTADGAFQTYVYALSREHAAAIVGELRESARLGGEIVGWVEAQ